MAKLTGVPLDTTSRVGTALRRGHAAAQRKRPALFGERGAAPGAAAGRGGTRSRHRAGCRRRDEDLTGALRRSDNLMNPGVAGARRVRAARLESRTVAAGNRGLRLHGRGPRTEPALHLHGQAARRSPPGRVAANAHHRRALARRPLQHRPGTHGHRATERIAGVAAADLRDLRSAGESPAGDSGK